MRKIILLSILTSLFTSTLNAQGWQRRFGEPGSGERGATLNRTADGGYFLRIAPDAAGRASELVRLDGDGEKMWSFAFDGADAAGRAAEIVGDKGEVYTTGGGNVVQLDAAGTLRRAFPVEAFQLAGIRADGLLLWKQDAGDSLKYRKYTLDGDLLWEKAYGFAGTLLDVRAGIDGRTFALYGQQSGNLLTSSQLYGFDPDAELQWSESSENPVFYQITLDPAENLVVYGSHSGQVSIRKLSPDGQLLSNTTYDMPAGAFLRHLTALPGGDFIVYTVSSVSPEASFQLTGLRTDGTTLWTKTYPTKQRTYFYDATPNSDGSFVLCGYVSESSGFDAGAPVDAVVWKFNSIGLLYPNLLKGRLALDANSDCSAQPNEPGLADWTISLNGLFSVSDSAGRFEMQADSGAGVLQFYPPGQYWQACPGYEQVNFPGLFFTDSVEIPIGTLMDCPQMEVSIGFQRMRRCVENTATLRWCNVGTAAEPQARILVVLPPELDFTGADWPLSQVKGDSLWFDIGQVDVHTCGSFQLRAVVDCDSTVNQQALCVEAHIFPDTFCLVAPAWSGAHVQVSARCAGDTAVEFRLRNTGSSPTAPVLDYIIIEDQVVLMSAPFNLGPGQEAILPLVPVSGSLYRIEAEQEPLHPGASWPIAWVEGCGLPENQGLSLQYPVDDADLFTDLDCHEVLGSYDPNDKTAQPLGYDAGHLIEPGVAITYRLRFQNTGNDTAFTVVLRDTLSPWLDPATVRPESASHPFTWNFAEGNVLKFMFNKLILPDSNTNGPASQGFIQFRVSPRTNVPLGTRIENRTAVYFDFNAPLLTNEIFHTVGRDFVLADLEPAPPGGPGVRMAPNPFRERTTFYFDKSIDGFMRLYDAQGRTLRQLPVLGTELVFDRGDLPAGVYFFDIQDAHGARLVAGKMMPQ